MTVDIWIRDYNPPRCFQKKISDRSKHNGNSLGTVLQRFSGLKPLKVLANLKIRAANICLNVCLVED
jgi:hypothetical protein